MKPILHTAEETSFSYNGIGALGDAISCTVTEELNGGYEMQIKYPIDGIFYSDIKLRSTIRVIPNKSDSPQPFRIYRITRPIGGIVTIYARHISYDLADIPVSPLTASDSQTAANTIQTNANKLVKNSFDIWTDIEKTAEMEITAPRSAKTSIMGQDGSFVDTYGGELHYDGYRVEILTRRGEDKGVKISYGINLTDLNQEENIADTYTGIYPYAIYDQGYIVQLPEKILEAEGDFGFTKIQVVDLSSKFISDDGVTAEITAETLREAAQEYMAEQDFGKPKVSLKVSFVSLPETEEYKNNMFLESVMLGDTVSVEFAKLGVSAEARCTKTVFNALTEQYESLTIGEPVKTIIDTLYSIQKNQK